MYKRKINLLIIFLLLLALSGCWDSLGIRKKNIVTTVIVDKTDTGYAFYVEIPLLGEKQGGESTAESAKKSFYLKSEGKSFADARTDLDNKSNKPIYLGAVQSVILTQKMVEDGIEEYLYRLRRIPDYRKTLKVVVTKEKPEDLLNANTENNELLGFALEDLLMSSIDLGEIVAFSLTDILDIINSPNKAYFVPEVGLEDKQTIITGYTIFYHDKTIGFIPIEESKGLLIIDSDKPILREAVPYQNNQYSIEARFSKRKNEVLYQDDQIIFTLKYKCKATLWYIEHNEAVTKQKMDGIAKEFEQILEKSLQDEISKSQDEFGCDYLKFYTFFRIKYPQLAKQLDWKEEFINVKFNVDVTVTLEMSGNINYNPYEK